MSEYSKAECARLSKKVRIILGVGSSDKEIRITLHELANQIDALEAIVEAQRKEISDIVSHVNELQDMIDAYQYIEDDL